MTASAASSARSENLKPEMIFNVDNGPCECNRELDVIQMEMGQGHAVCERIVRTNMHHSNNLLSRPAYPAFIARSVRMG